MLECGVPSKLGNLVGSLSCITEPLLYFVPVT
jgi:hypothetical protein